MGTYRYLEDIVLADAALEIVGEDLDDLFATAARALADLMVDPATLAETVTRTVHLEAPGLDLLLYDWLGELIFRKDRDGEVFPNVRVHVRAGDPYTLDGSLSGGVIEPGRTGLRADPKAVTLHEFRIEPTPAGWCARVVIDT
jgi:SHS2 domain-containing protein